MKNKLFKITSIIYLVVNILFSLFLILSLILAWAKVSIMTLDHFIIVLIAVGINLPYIVYLSVVLINNKKLLRK